MIDDRLILLPLCSKHLITRQDKLTPGVIELTFKAQPSSKLVAFSCGSCCKLHALLFMGKSIFVGSFVAIASIQVVLEAVYTGNFLLCFRPAAVIAGLRYIPPLISCIDCFPLRIAGGKSIVMLTIGIGVCLHLAIFPDRLHTIVPVHLCPTTIVVLFTAKTEHLRAGRCIPDSRDGLGIIDVDDVLIAAHVAVIDVQRLFIEEESGGIHGAVVKVNRDVMFSCTEIRVNIDYLSTCIKGAGIKCHDRGAIRPECISSIWSIEGRISEHCTFITPVEGLAVDDAVFYHCIVNTDEAQIICITGAKRHIFEGDCFGTIKAVIAVILCAEIGRVRHLSTDIPGRHIRPLPHKGQVFSLGRTNAADTVQRVIAFAQGDGITIVCMLYCLQKRVIFGGTDPRLSRCRTCSLIGKGHQGKHLKHHCHCQQGSQKPVLTFLFQLSSFLSSLFAFLQRIPRKEPSRFLPHCHLPCRFHFPHCRSQPGC